MNHDPLFEHDPLTSNVVDMEGRSLISREREKAAHVNHDPLCPLPDCDYGLPKGECMGYEDCWHHCACHVIAKARADEREKAAQRVSEVFWPTDGSWVTEETTFHAMGRAAIAAVRGES